MLREVTWMARWCESSACLPTENVDAMLTLHLPPYRHRGLFLREREAAAGVVGLRLGRAQREQQGEHAADAQDLLLQEPARQGHQLGQTADDRAQGLSGAFEVG